MAADAVVAMPSEDRLLNKVLTTLRTRETALAEMGVRHAAVFASVARGDNREDSEVNVIVDVDPDKVATIFDLGEIQQYLEEWLASPVDVARRDRLRPNVAAEVEREAVHAF
ncbi:MAG TPA: nucleotidyltransferase domain-containing protein [Acetobacteraceae bacterium]|nr:nucleotidyltransferase domain-containing protein [Acetobacteraceae bacterium]